jgi:hypothetical protein
MNVCARRDVLAPFPQRRHRQHDHVQPIVEIGAEQPVPHRRRQVAIRGRHDPAVHFPRARAADPLEPPGLQEVQELGLQPRRDVADLVQERGAAPPSQLPTLRVTAPVKT